MITFMNNQEDWLAICQGSKILSKMEMVVPNAYDSWLLSIVWRICITYAALFGGDVAMFVLSLVIVKDYIHQQHDSYSLNFNDNDVPVHYFNNNSNPVNWSLTNILNSYFFEFFNMLKPAWNVSLYKDNINNKTFDLGVNLLDLQSNHFKCF